MFFDCHLEVQTSELTQMPSVHRTLLLIIGQWKGKTQPGEGLFSPEDGPDFEDSVQIGGYGHLLVELRRLSQTGRLFKYIQFFRTKIFKIHDKIFLKCYFEIDLLRIVDSMNETCPK